MANFNMSVVTEGLLNSSSKEMKANSFEVQNIPLENITPNPLNEHIYKVGDIDTLAKDIQNEGLSQNFVVRPDKGNPGKYILVAGHRRYAAIKKIQETDPNFGKYVPCKIEKYDDSDDETIRLIMSNCTSREITDGEKLAAYQKLKEVVTNKIAHGKFNSNQRDFISQVLNISTTQVQRLKNITENLTPELQKKVATGQIGIRTADTMASMPKETQKTIANQFNENQSTDGTDDADPDDDEEEMLEDSHSPVSGGMSSSGVSKTWDHKKWQENHAPEDEDSHEQKEPDEEEKKAVLFGKPTAPASASDLQLSQLSALEDTLRFLKTIMIPNNYTHIPDGKESEVGDLLKSLGEDCKKLRAVFM